MKMYEINAELEAILAAFEPDPETGEVTASEETFERLTELQMEKAEKLDNCARAYFEAIARKEAIKKERDRLDKMMKSLDGKATSILGYLDYISGGEDLDCGVATLKHPKPRPSLKTTDVSEAVKWLVMHGHPDLYTEQEPKLDGNEVKKLLLNGEKIPGVELDYKKKAVLK